MLRDSVTRRQSVACVALEIAVMPSLRGRIANRVSRAVGLIAFFTRCECTGGGREAAPAPGPTTAVGNLLLDMSRIGNMARSPLAESAIELPKSGPPSLGFSRGPRP